MYGYDFQANTKNNSVYSNIIHLSKFLLIFFHYDCNNIDYFSLFNYSYYFINKIVIIKLKHFVFPFLTFFLSLIL